MSRRIDNAKALYLEGIGQGRAREAVERYTGARYTQHSTGVRDGVEGFVEFFEDFIARNPVRDIEIVRAIEDGPYVFVHAFQRLNDGDAQWVTTDLFDTDSDERIVEHWDVISAFSGPNPSGRTQIDGPTEVEDIESTASNKALVEEFIEVVLEGGRLDRAADYISSERYLQHNPQIADGLDGLATAIASMPEPMDYKYVFKVIGQGNFVVSYSLVWIDGDDHAVFDVFRVEEGKIVEHWDNMEPLPRGEMLVNRGKF